VNYEKCSFVNRNGVPYIYYFHLTGSKSESIQVEPLQNFPPPKTPKEVEKILGYKSGWYRQY
jgi:hypothetical protein